MDQSFSQQLKQQNYAAQPPQQPHNQNHGNRYNHHQSSQHPIRVIKPNRNYANSPRGGHSQSRSFLNTANNHYAANNNNNNANNNNNNNNNNHGNNLSDSASIPAVKILAKSNNKPPAAAATSNNLNGPPHHHHNNNYQSSHGSSQSGKAAIVAANRQPAGVINRSIESRESNQSKSSGNNADNGCNKNGRFSNSSVIARPPPQFSAVSVLEKRLSRLQIAPSAQEKERDQSHNCSKLLDGEFALSDSAPLERILLSDTSANSIGSTQSAASNLAHNFCIVGAVGMDGVGKSSLLNMIANRNVFKTRDASASAASPRAARNDNPLLHVTNGVDIHITTERLFLLDTQPLLSASILDEFLRNNNNASYGGGGHHHHHHHHYHHSNHHHHHHHHHMANGANGGGGCSLSSVVGFDISEPENFAFIYSMQLLTLMFAACDHLILVLDTVSLDSYLLKLLASALMMVGDTVQKANLIIYFKPPKRIEAKSDGRQTADAKRRQQHSELEFKRKYAKIEEDSAQFSTNRKCDNRMMMIDLLKTTIAAMLGPSVNLEFIADERQLLTAVLKAPSRSLLVPDSQSRPIQFTTERAWLNSTQRYWDAAIRKSNLFADYARYLP